MDSPRTVPVPSHRTNTYVMQEPPNSTVQSEDFIHASIAIEETTNKIAPAKISLGGATVRFKGFQSISRNPTSQASHPLYFIIKISKGDSFHSTNHSSALELIAPVQANFNVLDRIPLERSTCGSQIVQGTQDAQLSSTCQIN